MEITLNGEKKVLESSLTITELLQAEKVESPEMVSVEYNEEILTRDLFDTTAVNEGDQIEFLYFMGGGC